MQRDESIKRLSKIPGVGRKTASMLYDMGIKDLNDLKGKNPDEIYCKMSDKYGTWLDKCLLYVFRCAVYYAENSEHDPEKLKWWYWKKINNY